MVMLSICYEEQGQQQSVESLECPNTQSMVSELSAQLNSAREEVDHLTSLQLELQVRAI